MKIVTPTGAPNTDGIDPAAFTSRYPVSNITVTNSYISDGDDNVAIKGNDALISNLTFSHNHFYQGHGMPIGGGSNGGCSGTQSCPGVQNVLVTDLVSDGIPGTSNQETIHIKSNPTAGGEVSNLLYEKVCVQNGGRVLDFDPYYNSVYTGSGGLPNFHDITLRNVHALNRTNYNVLRGYNGNYPGIGTGIAYPLGITLDNVIIDGYQSIKAATLRGTIMRVATPAQAILVPK